MFQFVTKRWYQAFHQGFQSAAYIIRRDTRMDGIILKLRYPSNIFHLFRMLPLNAKVILG